MLKESARLLVDRKIDRRAFMTRVAQSGISIAGAAALANALVGNTAAAAAPDAAAPEPGRTVNDMTGGEVMLEFMQDWNVEYLFGLAGSEEVGLLDALVDRDVPFVTCIHENAAMAMADGYSRSTGKTPVVSLHSVAGAAYALGQLVGSFRDRVPVVVCAGRQATDYRGQDGFLEAAELHSLPQHYSQWTWDVMSADTIPEVLRRAFLYAEAPPGGPVFVTFSNDLWEKTVTAAEILPRSRSRVEDDIPPAAAHVEYVASHLVSADLPVLYLGNECHRFDISDEAGAIAEQTGALVMQAQKVPQVFPTTHPNFGGQFRTDDPQLAPRIDCFWSLGAHMFKFAKKPAEPLLDRKATIMHTSLAEADVGRNYPVDSAAYANIRNTTQAVLDELRGYDLNTSAIHARKQFVADYVARRRARIEEQRQREWDSKPVSVSRLMVELDRRMDEEAWIVTEIVTADSHIRKYLTFDHTQPRHARRRSFDTTSGILGWGMAAAIGVKIGNPGKEVWCLTGDGCFNFGSQALWSAARYEVPIGFIVFNNGEYQANRINQIHSGGKRMRATGKFIGVNLRHPDIDYVAMAKAYDIEGERVTEPSKLAAALKRCQRAMQDGRPYLVDVDNARRFEGSDSDYYDFFSVAGMQSRA